MATKRRPPPPSRPVSIEHRGSRYEGTYEIESGAITVRSAYGTKGTQLGGHAGSPDGLARLLLRELVQEDLATKR